MDDRLQMVSLDHAMWFHRPFRADEWLLYVQDTPSASSGAGHRPWPDLHPDGRGVRRAGPDANRGEHQALPPAPPPSSHFRGRRPRGRRRARRLRQRRWRLVGDLPRPDVRAAPTTAAFPGLDLELDPHRRRPRRGAGGLRGGRHLRRHPMAVGAAGRRRRGLRRPRGGRLVRLDPTAGDAQAGPTRSSTSPMTCPPSPEQGFLGVAFAPDGEQLYVSYTNPDGDTRIDEYAVDGTEGRRRHRRRGSPRREVLAVDQPCTRTTRGAASPLRAGRLLLNVRADGGAGGEPEDRARTRPRCSVWCASIRLRAGVDPRDPRGTTPTSAAPTARGGPVEIWLQACATRGAGRSTRPPATSGSPTSGTPSRDRLPAQDGTGPGRPGGAPAGRPARLRASNTHDDGGCSPDRRLPTGRRPPRARGRLATDYCRGHLQGPSSLAAGRSAPTRTSARSPGQPGVVRSGRRRRALRPCSGRPARPHHRSATGHPKPGTPPGGGRPAPPSGVPNGADRREDLRQRRGRRHQGWSDGCVPRRRPTS